ncbi:acyl-coenzyme A thioesterase 13 [Biomphalaria glabrata]|nr:acyl-coenzyme A thioesterase 13 [Biomphalaria glabrata]
MALKNGGKLTFEAMKVLVADRVKTQGFENIFNKIKVVSGGNGQCCCELQVSPNMLNAAGTLHGGVTASLVDAVSTYALFTVGNGKPGSSVDLNISFLKPVKPEDVLEISAKTLSCGSRIAFSSVDIKNKATGQLVAQGRHTKFVG